MRSKTCLCLRGWIDTGGEGGLRRVAGLFSRTSSPVPMYTNVQPGLALNNVESLFSLAYLPRLYKHAASRVAWRCNSGTTASLDFAPLSKRALTASGSRVETIAFIFSKL